jgi:hypothetical protein
MAAIFVWQFIVSTQFIPRNTCFIVFRLGDIRVGLHYIVNGILYTTLNLKPDFRYTQQETFSTSILCGQVKGDTKLPMSAVCNDVDCSVSDQYSRIIPLLESAITTWTRQIKHVLAQDPEMIAKQGLWAT